jgi:hypothetical protein
MSRWRFATPTAIIRPMRWDQAGLAVAGIAAFVLGTSVHRDRSNLAVALVALGAFLLLIAALLPRLQSLSGKVAGTEFSVSLLPPTSAVSDRVLVQSTGAPGAAGGHDLRGGATVAATGLSGFGEAIKGGPAVFVVANLEDGRAWLSSRLYVFASALAELRGIQAVMFTARSADIDRFLGTSSLCDVLNRFEWAFPWLAGAFGSAWDLARVRPDGPPRRRLAPDAAELLYDNYVGVLRRGGPQPPNRPEEWVRLNDGLSEHATWLDQALIRELLGDSLSNDFVIGEPDRDETMERVVDVGRGRWVAVLDNELRAKTLVDRWLLLDRAASRATTPKPARAV